MVVQSLRRGLVGLSVVAAGCLLLSPSAFAAESERRVLFDFEVTKLGADWVATGQITATREAVPDADGVEGLRPVGQGMTIRAGEGGGVYCRSGSVPQDWRWFRELTFWVYRSPDEAARRPKSTIEIRAIEADRKAGFWRRIDVDHSGWKKISVPLRWFRWAAGRVPRWDRVDRFGLSFRDGADLTVDTFALTLGEPGRTTNADLTADDLLEVAFPDDPQRPRVYRGDYVTLITDVEQLDTAALARQMADVAAAMQKDFPFLQKPPAVPILLLFSSREAFEWYPSRVAQKFGDTAPRGTTSGFSAFGVAASFWDENLSAPSPGSLRAFADSLWTLSTNVNSPGNWLNSGISRLYLLRFYPQENVDELVRPRLESPQAQMPLEGLCDGRSVAENRQWQAVTLIDMLRTQSRYRAALPKLFEAFRESGSTDLAPHLQTVLGTDWDGLSADWQAYCRRTYGTERTDIASPTLPVPGPGPMPALDSQLPQTPTCVGWDQGWAVYRYSPEDNAWKSFTSPATPLPRLGVVGVGSRAAAALDPYDGFSGWYLDLSTQQWRQIPASPITPYAREGSLLHGVERVSPDALDKISFAEVPVVFAGDRLVVLVRSVSQTVHGAVFDPQTWRWSAIPDPPIELRFRYPNAVVGNQFVIWGGYPNYPQDGAVLDLDRRLWRKIPAAPIKFVYGMVHTAWRGRLVVVGGRLEAAKHAGAVYDLATQTWSTIPRPDFELGTYSACAAVGDELFLWSGSELDRGGAIFNFQTGKWRKVGNAPIPARSVAHTLSVGRKIFVWGGWVTSGASRTDGAVYDLTSNTWEKLPDMPRGIPYALHPGW